jgi:Tol biopolymer transport system component/tRNA A-37 threonylcarbamoyl transferase component Bud32
MTPDDDPALRAAAHAIDAGERVDWDALESSGAISSSFAVILRELRVVADIVRLHRTPSGPVTSSPTADDVASLAVESVPPGAAVIAPSLPATWGPLRLLELVGHGAFGDVYRAWDPRLDREVALKLLRRGGARSDSVGSQVINEGRMLARVRHPNVVTVFGADRIDGRVGLWMEFVRGRTLEAVLRDHGPFGAQEATIIGLDLCRALSAVHGTGLIHRDVKAQNVMREAGGRLVLMDFGTGREAFDGASPELAGTPLYLAPEVFEDEAATTKSDLYGVGVLLFHLVAGSYPVTGRSVAAIRAAHRERRRTWLRDARPDLPPAFVDVVERALDPDPGRRFESAGALESALARGVLPAAAAVATTAAASATVTEMPAAIGGETAGRRSTAGKALIIVALLAVAVASLVAFASPTWRGRVLGGGGSEPGSRSAARVATDMSPVVRRVPLPGYGTIGGPSGDGRLLSLADDSGNLAVVDLASGELRRVTTDAVLDEHSQFAQNSALSADGQSVAYAWFALDGTFELRAADIEGRRPRVLLRGEDIAYPWPVEWSRDGRSILALLQKKDHSHQIALVSASDGTVRVVKHLGMTPPLHASLSPDGAYVVYDHPQQPNEFPRDIFIVAADGSSDWPLVRAPSADIEPVWAPDGAHVLFASDRSGAMDIWSVAVDRGTAQGEPEVIHRNVGRLLTLGLTDTGSYFYHQTLGAVEVYQAQLGVDGVKSATAFPTTYSGSNISSIWSPDGRRLAYVSRRGPVGFDRGFTTLVIRDLQTGRQRELVPAMRSFLVRSWSPDGRNVLVQGMDAQGRTGAHAIDVETGAVAPIVTNPRPDRNDIRRPDWRSDGRVLYVDSARQVLLARDVVAGSESPVFDFRKAGIEVVAHVYGRGYRLSPDGRTLAYTAASREGETRSHSLWITGLDGGPARELVRVTAPDAVMFQDWTPDGTAVLYTRWTIADGPQPVALWRVPIAGGEPQSLGFAPIGLRDVSVHPDGSGITYTAGWPVAEVWTIDHLVSGRRD